MSPESATYVVLLDMKAATQRDFAIWESRTGWGEQYPIWTLDELRKEFPELEIVLIDIADPGVLNSIVEEPGLKFGFNLGISRRLPDTVLEVFSGGVINVHPGLLPRYRGSSAVEWAILEKEFVGCSVHLMVAELDGGPLTLREKYVFPSSFRYRDVRQFVYERQVFLLTNFAECAQRGMGLMQV